jgi:hypothetical protein
MVTGVRDQDAQEVSSLDFKVPTLVMALNLAFSKSARTVGMSVEISINASMNHSIFLTDLSTPLSQTTTPEITLIVKSSDLTKQAVIYNKVGSRAVIPVPIYGAVMQGVMIDAIDSVIDGMLHQFNSLGSRSSEAF